MHTRLLKILNLAIVLFGCNNTSNRSDTLTPQQAEMGLADMPGGARQVRPRSQSVEPRPTVTAREVADIIGDATRGSSSLSTRTILAARRIGSQANPKKKGDVGLAGQYGDQVAWGHFETFADDAVRTKYRPGGSSLAEIEDDLATLRLAFGEGRSEDRGRRDQQVLFDAYRRKSSHTSTGELKFDPELDRLETGMASGKYQPFSEQLLALKVRRTAFSYPVGDKSVVLSKVGMSRGYVAVIHSILTDIREQGIPTEAGKAEVRQALVARRDALFNSLRTRASQGDDSHTDAQFVDELAEFYWLSTQMQSRVRISYIVNTHLKMLTNLRYGGPARFKDLSLEANLIGEVREGQPGKEQVDGETWLVVNALASPLDTFKTRFSEALDMVRPIPPPPE